MRMDLRPSYGLAVGIEHPNIISHTLSPGNRLTHCARTWAKPSHGLRGTSIDSVATASTPKALPKSRLGYSLRAFKGHREDPFHRMVSPKTTTARRRPATVGGRESLSARATTFHACLHFRAFTVLARFLRVGTMLSRAITLDAGDLTCTSAMRTDGHMALLVSWYPKSPC